MNEPKFCVVCGSPLEGRKQTLCGNAICKSEQKRRNSKNYRDRRSGLKPIWVPKSVRNVLNKKKPKTKKCSICGKRFLAEGNFRKCLDCRGKFKVRCLQCGLPFISASSSPYQRCGACKKLILEEREARRAKAKVKQKRRKKPYQGKVDFSKGEIWVLDEETWEWKAEQRGEKP